MAPGNESIHQQREIYTNLLYKKDDALPQRYGFVLTALCNLSCPFCYQNHALPHDPMRVEDWLRVVEQLPEYARVTLAGGEPLIFKGFKEVAHAVATRYPTNIITNGTLLDSDKIEFLLTLPHLRVLSVSIDTIGNANRGFTPALWEKFVANVKLFHEKRVAAGRDDIVLDVKTVLYGGNTNELVALYEFIHDELHCDTNSFTFLVGSPLQCNTVPYSEEELFVPRQAPVLPDFSALMRALEDIRRICLAKGYRSFLMPRYGHLDSPSPLPELASLLNVVEHHANRYESCMYPWSSIQINPDCSVVPCLAYKVGDARRQTLREIVSGAAMRRFRELILSHGTVQACNRCVWLKPKGALPPNS